MKTTDNIEKMLTPQCEFKASSSLKDRILEAAAQEEITTPARPRLVIMKYLATSVAAAIALLAVLFIGKSSVQPTYAAEKIFADAAEILNNLNSYTAILKVRTDPQENFSYINPWGRFVEHTVTVQQSNGHWSIDKGGRKAVYDGTYTWQWLPESQFGWKYDNENIYVIDDFALLLDLPSLMVAEENIALASNGACITKTESDEVITLVVTSPAQGDFTNEYSRNTSILESDTIREYEFSKEDGELLSLKISTKILGVNRVIVEMTDLKYAPGIKPSTFAVDEDIEWIDNTELGMKVAYETLPFDQFTGITAEEAVVKMFDATSVWDEDFLKVVLRNMSLRQMEKIYKGCRLLEYEPSFKSGLYNGVFVKCKVKMADGRTKKLVVALRNDNPTMTWTADGGL